MKNKIESKGVFSGILMWAFLLCVAWFGHFNNWWPAAFPITFTVIVCALYGIALIAAIIYAVLSNW